MTYNGWKNYETWNVALWIQNDEPLYRLALGWAEHGYKSLAHILTEEFGPVTPDMVAWNDHRLDHGALTEMLAEL